MIEFKTEKFSGPLGLLLRLIEKEELDITEISLAKIADEYVEYIRAAAHIDPEQIADFLVVAAKLLFIKSKALLPYLTTEEEQQEIDDLEKQLRMYKEFADASRHVEALLKEKHFSFPKDFTKINRRTALLNGVSFSPPKNVNQEAMRIAFDRLLEVLLVKEEVIKEEHIEAIINIEDRITYFQGLLLNKAKINFSEIIRSAKTKTEKIVNFLAVLELAKQRELIFEQEELFSEIIINKIS